LRNRIEYLDGLRGIAILLVIVYHAYVRWTPIVPYKDSFADVFIFKLGHVGVELFFLISGFVIFMTLDKTENFRKFIFKRWLRLFPAMLIASVLIYGTSFIFYERPAGTPTLFSLLPGLTFIEPEIWRRLLHVDFNVLEGAFWSLYVEFKFYIIAGFVYYFLGRRYLPYILFIMYLISILISLPLTYNSNLTLLLHNISTLFSLDYFGWFCSGTLFYLYYHTKSEYYYIFGILIALLSSYTLDGLDTFMAAFLISILFALSIRVEILQKILSQRFFLFFGLVSYPLYLLHENAMISMIIKSKIYLPWLPEILYPVLPVFILTVVAYFIATRYEKMIVKILK